MAVTKRAYLLHVGRPRYLYAAFPLNGLHQKARHVRCALQDPLKCHYIVIGDGNKARHEGAVILISRWVTGKGNHRRRATMEILPANDNLGLLLGNPLFSVSPTPTYLDGSLHALHTRVHGKYLVKAKKRAQVVLKMPQTVIVQCPRGDGKGGGLFPQCCYNLGMAVPLIDRGIGRQKIVVAPPRRVVEENTRTPTDNHWKRCIVVGTISVFQRTTDVVWCGRSVSCPESGCLAWA